MTYWDLSSIFYVHLNSHNSLRVTSSPFYILRLWEVKESQHSYWKYTFVLWLEICFWLHIAENASQPGCNKKRSRLLSLLTHNSHGAWSRNLHSSVGIDVIIFLPAPLSCGALEELPSEAPYKVKVVATLPNPKSKFIRKKVNIMFWLSYCS